MNTRTFQQLVLTSPGRLAMPIATYLALALTGAKVSDIVSNPHAQLEAQAALRQRHPSPFALSAKDLAGALRHVSPEVVACGNLGPAAVFVQSSPSEIKARVSALLSATAAHPNFVLSSGCDEPPTPSLASLDAFYDAANPTCLTE